MMAMAYMAEFNSDLLRAPTIATQYAMMPNAMPLVMEYVRSIIMIVSMTAMVRGTSSQSMPLSSVIIAAPTMNIAPAVHLKSTIWNTGPISRDTAKNMATNTAVSPVLEPASIPTADSANAD